MKLLVTTGINSLRRHWPEYLCEAVLLGLFMVSACGFAIALFHPQSPAAMAIDSPLARRFLMGLAMGLTVVALVYSPLGQRSGAHMNPAMTLAFWRLGKVRVWDAVFYIFAQFLGGIAGVGVMMLVAHSTVMHQSVNYVITQPASADFGGLVAAWAAEFLIAAALMFVVLVVSNRPSLAAVTPLFAGVLVMLYITIESPISGMSMNPARTAGSAFWASIWTGLWVYLTAPPLAMLLASQVYLALPGARRVYCAKLHHFNSKRCIFNCEFHAMIDRPAGANCAPQSEKPNAMELHLKQRTLFYG